MIQTEDTTIQEDWWDETVDGAPLVIEEELGPVTVAHVVDNYNRYPGEVVALYTRLKALEPLADLTLRISLPEGLILGDYRAPAEQEGLMPMTEVSGDTSYLVWSLAGKLPEGACYEYRAEAVVAPAIYDTTLTSQAVVSGKDGDILTEETVNIAVWVKGKYLRYLPSIYERDDFMGRFLMLFESFWSPIETQIDGVYNYFDPRITPPDFLPWLASWLDLDLDESWPEDRLRRLLRWAIALHRSRGTKWGLLKYLELYTEQQAEIIERRAENFVLGAGARLGPGIALGQGNTPHTFAVTLHLPPIEVKGKRERKRREEQRRRTIEKIIEMQKPAHTVYTLNIKTLSEEKETKPEAEDQTKKAKTETDEIAAQAAIWFKLDDY